ncbi:uncharacterized protein LOC111867980 isoform X2 [Cryptotermes secundus]|nr:uncharacterized protein LOC111867980 isoform X2 [Cryptotermes secundus]
MLCGHAPFQVQPGDDGAAVMARIKGEEFGSDIDALDHISLEAKYVTKGLLTADPKDRLKLSDLTYNGWVQGFSVIAEPTTLLLIPDSAFHVAYQEVVVDDEWAQRTWTEELSTDTCSYSTPSTHSATSSSGVPLAEVVSGSSASAISHVTEDKSHNSGLTLFVTSGGPLIQPRKRKRSEAASSFFLTYENYYDDNYINVKCKKRRYTAL